MTVKVKSFRRVDIILAIPPDRFLLILGESVFGQREDPERSAWQVLLHAISGYQRALVHPGSALDQYRSNVILIRGCAKGRRGFLARRKVFCNNRV